MSDCCKQNKEEGKTSNDNKFRYYLMIGVVGVVLVLSLYQSIQISSLKSGSTGTGAVVSSSGAIDTSSWSADEKMMYEHHGTLPARLQGSQPKSAATAPRSAGMVGGC
jgi:hypothetical protein